MMWSFQKYAVTCNLYWTSKYNKPTVRIRRTRLIFPLFQVARKLKVTKANLIITDNFDASNQTATDYDGLMMKYSSTKPIPLHKVLAQSVFASCLRACTLQLLTAKAAPEVS